MSMVAVDSVLLAAAIGLPLLAAGALAVARWRTVGLNVAPWAAVPALLLALTSRTGSSLQLPWLIQHTSLELDAIGRIFLGFTSALWLASSWYARSYLARDSNPVRFYLFFLLAMWGNFVLILAGDAPTFYVGFAAMGLASAGLVFHRGDAVAARAGKVYLILAMVGEVLILSGLVYVTAISGTTQIAELHRGVISQTSMLLLLAGFGIKAGALSLHFWLPLAHPAAPVPASAVLSGAMIKAGLLGWIRFLPLGNAAIPEVGLIMICAGLGAAFLGTLVGAVQSNPKTVLAYSSISQMGIITTGLGIGAFRPDSWLEIQTAVLIYATHHALSKGSLFLSLGPAQAARTRLQRAVVRVGLLVPALALAGAPFTSGALAKLVLKSNLVFLPDGWTGVVRILLTLAAVGTTLKMTRFLWLAWPRSTNAPEDTPPGLWTPWLSLLAAVVLGVWLLPGALGWVPSKLTAEKLWLATWPLLLGAALAAIGAKMRRWMSRDPSHWLPAGDMGVLLEKAIAHLQPREGAPFGSPGSRRRAAGAVETPSRWTVRWNSLGRWCHTVEKHLRSSPVAGAMWLFILALLLGLLVQSVG